jgi:hypothetical protein
VKSKCISNGSFTKRDFSSSKANKDASVFHAANSPTSPFVKEVKGIATDKNAGINL